MINANARRLATLAPDAASNERVRRIEEQEKVYAKLLVQGGLATSELEAREKFFAAAHFHGIITARHETPRQLVEELAYTSLDYMDFVHRVGHDGGFLGSSSRRKTSLKYRLKDKKTSIESKKTSWQALRGSPGATGR